MLDEFSLPARYQVPSDGNLADLVHQNAERHPGVAVLSRKSAGQWQDLTAAQFLAEVHAVAKGLVATGVGPGDRVAVMSRTRYEWTLLDFAIWTAGAITVPVYETSSAEQVQWILGDSGALAVVTETDQHAAVVDDVRGALPGLAHTWQIERGGIAALTLAGAGVDDAVIAERRALAGPDSIATIVYTSGTTGRPKGCQLTHGNFLAELGNVTARMPELFRTGESSVLLFLPLAHVLGRIAEIAAAIAPVKLGHVSDVKNVTEELGSFKPTLILGVPRVFEKVYNTARAKAQSDGKGRIFDRAADTAVAYSRALDTGRPRSACASGTRSSTGWSTASSATPSAGAAGTPSPAAPRSASGSATSTAASASSSWRATASPSPAPRPPSTRTTSRRSAPSASRCPAPRSGSPRTARSCSRARRSSPATGTTPPPPPTPCGTAGSPPATSARWTTRAT